MTDTYKLEIFSDAEQYATYTDDCIYGAVVRIQGAEKAMNMVRNLTDAGAVVLICKERQTNE